MANDLTADEITILRYMSDHGAYTPGTKARFNAARELVAKGYAEPYDAHPGSYEITAAGEHALEEHLEDAA